MKPRKSTSRLVKAREDPAIALQAAEQALDLVAPLVQLPVVLPRVHAGRDRRHHRREPQIQRQLAGLVTLVGAVHHQRQRLVVRSPVREELAPFRRIVGLAGGKRERYCRMSIRGNQMNLGGPPAAGFADGLWGPFFLAPPCRRDGP